MICHLVVLMFPLLKQLCVILHEFMKNTLQIRQLYRPLRKSDANSPVRPASMLPTQTQGRSTEVVKRFGERKWKGGRDAEYEGRR